MKSQISNLQHSILLSLQIVSIFLSLIIILWKKFMCITKVSQPGNFLNVQFGNIDFFKFLQNQNKTVSTMESRL